MSINSLSPRETLSLSPVSNPKDKYRMTVSSSSSFSDLEDHRLSNTSDQGRGWDVVQSPEPAQCLPINNAVGEIFGSKNSLRGSSPENIGKEKDVELAVLRDVPLKPVHLDPMESESSKTSVFDLKGNERRKIRRLFEEKADPKTLSALKTLQSRRIIQFVKPAQTSRIPTPTLQGRMNEMD